MGLYSSLFGKRVEVHYRAGDIHLSATATLVHDNGSRISLEDHVSHDGKDKTIRIEVPYDYLIRIAEVRPEPEPVADRYFSFSKK